MPARRHKDVVEALLGRIVAGEFSAGDLLPKEVALAEEYGVNRGTAREALRALEERHVAIVKHGLGSTVQDQASWDSLDPAVAAALLIAPGRTRFARELREALAAVESEIAAMAATRAKRADRDALAAALREGDDASFAAELARIAGNRPLASAAAALRRIDAQHPLPEDAAHAIHVAVSSGDADAARAAMLRARS